MRKLDPDKLDYNQGFKDGRTSGLGLRLLDAMFISLMSVMIAVAIMGFLTRYWLDHHCAPCAQTFTTEITETTEGR